MHAVETLKSVSACVSSFYQTIQIRKDTQLKNIKQLGGLGCNSSKLVVVSAERTKSAVSANSTQVAGPWKKCWITKGVSSAVTSGLQLQLPFLTQGLDDFCFLAQQSEETVWRVAEFVVNNSAMDFPMQQHGETDPIILRKQAASAVVLTRYRIHPS